MRVVRKVKWFMKLCVVVSLVGVCLLSSFFLKEGHSDENFKLVRRNRNPANQIPQHTAPFSSGEVPTSAAKLGRPIIVKVWPSPAVQSDKHSQKDNQDSIDSFAPKHSSSKSTENLPDSQQKVCDKDEECMRFRQKMSTWPVDKPKAVIYFLTRSSRLGYLKNVLESLDKYFNNYYHYPVLIFHEQDLTPVRTAVRKYSNSSIFFQEVVFMVPPFIRGPLKEYKACPSPIGYRHMCRFHSKTVYEEPIMSGLDYAWRLDDDSLLLRNVTYDVFRFMRSRDLTYGYIWRHVDSYDCTVGLWDATRKFINRTHFIPQYFDEWRDPLIFYNNFEISKISLWMSADYRNYVNYIDSLGGIYYYRWGDAPIKGIAVSLFVPKNRTHRFHDVGYKHASLVNT